MKPPTFHVLALTFLAVACGAETAPAHDSRVFDASLDAEVPDGALDGSGRDTSAEDSSGSRDVATSDANAHGFVVRMPGEVILTPGSQTAYQDKDFGCTLRAGGNNAIVYLQATPTGVSETGFFPTPLYGDVHAWLHDLNAMSTREIPATYDFGGGPPRRSRRRCWSRPWNRRFWSRFFGPR